MKPRCRFPVRLSAHRSSSLLPVLPVLLAPPPSFIFPPRFSFRSPQLNIRAMINELYELRQDEVGFKFDCQIPTNLSSLYNPSNVRQIISLVAEQMRDFLYFLEAIAHNPILDRKNNRRWKHNATQSGCRSFTSAINLQTSTNTKTFPQTQNSLFPIHADQTVQRSSVLFRIFTLQTR